MSPEVNPDFSSESTTTWESMVRSGLAARKNEATDAEVRRLGKTLGRLEASAVDSIKRAQLADDNESAAQKFAAALEALGHD